MADYRIRIATELDTKGIDTGISQYNKKKLIEIKSKLDTSGIDTNIAKYNNKKSISINARLNTKGLAKQISGIKPKTPINLNARLDSKSINASIKSLSGKKSIKINVTLDKSNINEQIKSHKTSSSITVKAKLDKASLTEQINKYQSKPIKLDARLNKKNIDDVIRGYKASPIKLSAKLNKGEINEQIKGFKPKNTIYLKASLKKGAIAKEIRDYKPSTPISVDLRLGSTDIDKEIKKYEKTPVNVHAKLLPAPSGFAEKLTKVPIKIPAELSPEAINNFVAAYQKNPVTIPVKFRPIEDSSKGTISTEPISVNAKLDQKDISTIRTQLRNAKPKTPITVKAILDKSAIDTAIAEYESKSPTIRVNVVANKANIDEKTVKQNAQVPIKVNAKLDTKTINEQIRGFKTQTKLGVGIKLDAKNINQQINNIKTKSLMKIGVKLDTKGISGQIKAISTKTPVKIQVQIDTKNVQSQINNIKRQIEQLGNIRIVLGGTGGTGRGSGSGIDSTVKEVNKAYTDLMNLAKRINSIRLEIGGLDASKNSIRITELSGQLNRLMTDYNNLYNTFTKGLDTGQLNILKNKINSVTDEVNRLRSAEQTMSKQGIDTSTTRANINALETELRELLFVFNNVSGGLTPSQIDNLTNTFQVTTDKVAALNAKLADTKAKLASDITLKVNTNTISNQISALETRFGNLKVKTTELSQGMELVRNAQTNLNAAIQSGDIDKIISEYQIYKQVLQDVTNQIDMQARAEAQLKTQQKLVQDKTNLSLDMSAWLKKNSAAAGQFGDRIRDLQAELKTCDATRFDGIKSEFRQIRKEAEVTGKTGLTFGDRLRNQFSRLSTYFSATMIIMQAIRGLRSMFQQVKEIDLGMTELKKVTNETNASYNNFLDRAASKAKELGTTIDGLVKSTADFARLGYEFRDAQGLAEVANIYAVVGDEVEGVEGATESLISTMAAYKDEMNGLSEKDFAMEIIDVFNELGNNFAISSGGIGEAFKRSASSMAAANNTFRETAALITAANTVTQDPDVVGTAFKTMSMRIRGAKTEMEEAGLETEGMVESTAKLRQEILALSGVDIMQDNNTFKSTYKILEELSKKWQDLTDIQQASITELIAGKRQGNIVSSLMNNFEIAQEALGTSLDSSGSAMEEHRKWQKSLEAQINNLKAAWQGLSQEFLNSTFLKNGIKLLTKIVTIVEKLVKTFGTLGTVSLGASLYGLFKKGGTFSAFFPGLVNSLSGVGSAGKHAADGINKVGKAAQTTGKHVNETSGSLQKAGTIIGLVIAAIGLVVNAIRNAEEESSRLRQETIETSNAFLDSAISFEKAYIKYSGKTNLTTEEESELESAIKGTVDALDDKSSALQNAVNSSNDYVASLERIAAEEIRAANTAAKNKRDAAKLELEKTVSGWFAADSEVNVRAAIGSVQEVYEEETAKIAAKVAKDNGGKFGEITSTRSTDTIGFVLSPEASMDEILDYYYMLKEYQEELSDAKLIDTMAYDDTVKVIDKMSEAIKTYTEGVYDAAKASYQLENGIPKTTEEYLKMREAVLNEVGGNIETRATIAGTLDTEYKDIFDLTTVEVQAKKLIGVLDEYGDTEAGTMETFLNMRTAVNGNECTVGEYLSQFTDINKMTRDWSDEAKEELNTTFGLDTDSIKQDYDEMHKYLRRNYLDKLDTSGMRALDIAQYRDIEGDKVKDFLKGLTASELSALVSIRTEIDWESGDFDKALDLIEEQVKINDALNFSANIEVDKTELEAFNNILSESASAMGLTEESIDSLGKKYADLESYNPHTLFEKTGNGIKVNREEVAKLEKEYNDLKKTEVKKHLDTLVEEYKKCNEAIDGNIGSTEKLRKISEREMYAEQIEELAEYQAQLEGVTGAYQRWIDAQNTPQEYEGYQAVATGREDVESEIKRGFISSATKEYIDLLSGEDLVGGTIDDYAEAWGRLDEKVGSTSYSIHDFFTVNDDGDITATGIDRFFEGVRKDFEGEIYKIDQETGKWYYDFSKENLQKIQDEWGMGVEAIELMLEAAQAAGYDIDWGGIFDDLDIDVSNFESVEAMIALAEKAQEEFNKLDGIDDVEFNFRTNNIEEATTEVEKARKAYVDLITNDDGTINLKADGAEQMQFMLSTLITQKQLLSTPAIMKVDTSQIDDAKTDVIEVVNAAQALQTAYENYEIAISTGIDVEGAKKDLDSAIDGMTGTSVDVRADLKLPTDAELQAAKDGIGDIKVGATLDGTAISNLTTKIQTECTPEVIAKVTGLDESVVASESHQVVYTAEHKDVDDFLNTLTDISKKIIYEYETEGTKPNPQNIKRTITYTYETEGESPAAGTAHASGTTGSGRAFARGNWGIKGSGVALGGELGQELVVRDGRFFTIGDNGAEFFQYKQNDIVFNAAQTESLFKYGGIKGAKPRGKMLATGSAFNNGSAQTSGRAFSYDAEAMSSNFANNRKEVKTKTKTSTKDNSVITTTEVNFSANASESNFSNNRNSDTTKTNKKSKKSSKDTKDEFEETFDWVEVAISRLERSIDRLDKKASSTWRSWSTRNTSLRDEISLINDEIQLQEQAYDRYIQEANSVGLSDSWKKKVQSGKIDIETIEDEDLAEKIKSYQEWYEKALACKDAVLDLQDAEADKYSELFDNVVSKYDGILQGFEHTESMLNEYISQAEERGHIVSKEYYNALTDNENANLKKLKKEKADLIASRQEYYNAMRENGMSDAAIKNSEQWASMSSEIDGVTEAIEESETAILSYANSMREIDWSVFDLVQERMSAVTSEADFLIELMSNDKMYDDNGKLTSQGVATMALHGQNYNTHMYQADEYGAEIARLNKQIKKDPYDQELINRRNELIEAQRESILAAEDEKQAIRDLVEEGIEVELDALQERIDKYNEAMDSAKDLYDYQKKVKEQTKEIASLEKQMAAYSGDDSEESKAKIQELKVSLEEAKAELQETEYDKYISDQQALLDNLYTEYELVLNQRLDNVDDLLGQVVDGINAAMGADGTITSALGAEGAIASAIVSAVGENGSIKSILNTEATSVGSTLSTAMNNIWSVGDGNAKSILTMYGNGFQNQQTTTNTVLGNIKADVNKMVQDSNKDAEKEVESPATETSANQLPKNSNNSNAGSGGKKEDDKKNDNKNKGNFFIPKKNSYPKSKLDVNNSIVDRLKYHDYDSSFSARTKYYSAMGYKDKYKGSSKQNQNMISWMKKNGYAKGAYNLPEKELAWTQENGQEFIIRPSDGAILTPIARGDSVLTSAASSNIWNMANSPTEFIKDNLKVDASNVPSGSSVHSCVQNFESIVFSMPNVKNYNDLLTEMQRDPKFEKLILAMTVDQIAGKSSLAKNKAIR